MRLVTTAGCSLRWTLPGSPTSAASSPNASGESPTAASSPHASRRASSGLKTATVSGREVRMESEETERAASCRLCGLEEEGGGGGEGEGKDRGCDCSTFFFPSFFTLFFFHFLSFLHFLTAPHIVPSLLVHYSATNHQSNSSLYIPLSMNLLTLPHNCNCMYLLLYSSRPFRHLEAGGASARVRAHTLIPHILHVHTYIKETPCHGSNRLNAGLRD